MRAGMAVVRVAVAWGAKHGFSAFFGIEGRLATCTITGVVACTLMILWSSPSLVRGLSEFLRPALSLGPNETRGQRREDQYETSSIGNGPGGCTGNL